jgi:hypothetical protein
MKKYLLIILIFIFAVVFIHAQGLGEVQGIEYRDSNPAAPAPASVSQLDTSVKTLAQGLNRKLGEVKAGKIAVGQFAYRGNIVPLGNYWTSQLTGELANMPNKSYVVLSGGLAGADYTISGEIIDTDSTAIRIYARLIRADNRAIEASFNFDFQKNPQIIGLLIAESGQGGRSSSSSVAPDALEPDSFEAPVPYELGSDPNVQVVNRTLHSGDEDFFLIIPGDDGQLLMETTGSTDTYMEFYNEQTREKLGQNDDGGSGSNARIRYRVQSGTRYIAKVRGCSSSDTGSYGFRASLAVRTSTSTFDNPVPYEIGSDENAAIVNRTLDREDEEYFLLVPANDGQLIAETTGSTDTYMELYIADTRQKLAENDDGGRNGNARIRYDVQAGKRYIAKVRGCDSSDSGPYGFHAWIHVQVRLTPDEYEPDNDSNSAKQIEIGKPQQHNFHNANDVDWVKFQITRPGRYVIRTRGANTNRLDTYIELFDSKMSPIDNDDDGGDGVDSRLSLNLESGLYYLKVECLDGNPDQPYNISIEAER